MFLKTEQFEYNGVSVTLTEVAKNNALTDDDFSAGKSSTAS
ncbi:TPA: hypothetical protein ODL18_004784 [Escherichia coli]|nr:hypothetical protein [Escherichia coli]HCP2896508.1 hypothetical protein [Escherichia coli]HCP4547932.1 hypothetical protein [Escherichia coli]